MKSSSDDISDERAVIETIRSWYGRSRIDYAELYIQLYIAYNAWYRYVTGAGSDHEALLRVKRRVVIWDDYARGRTMSRLSQPFAEVVRLTHQYPLEDTPSWSGIVLDSRDYRGLISFWYRVRCDVVHGAVSPTDYLTLRYIKLAYRTLSIFMDEITLRMSRAFTGADKARLDVLLDISSKGKALSEAQKYEKRLLERHFVSAPSICDVDMVRNEQNNPLLKPEKRL